MALSGGKTMVFGTLDGETYGYIQSDSVSKAVETATVRGDNGDEKAFQQLNEKWTLSLSYSPFATSTGDPALGALFTYDGTAYVLETIDYGTTVDGFATVDVTGTYYTALGTPDA